MKNAGSRRIDLKGGFIVMNGTYDAGSRKLYKAPGARALQFLFLKHLEKLLREKPRARFFGPVRVVVPSGSLRTHLSALITDRLGAVAGLRVQTLHSLAWEVVERGYSRFSKDCGDGEFSNAPFQRHPEMLPILVERCARENVLWKELAELDDPFGILVGTVRDLLDSGFEIAQGDALRELLQDINADEDEVARALAVMDTAEKVLACRRELGVRLDHELPGLARRLLQDNDPEKLYPTRCTLVYGFSDATGEVTELLRVIVGRLNGSVYLDKPRPLSWIAGKDFREDSEKRGFMEPVFSDRFEERLSDIVSCETFTAPPSAGVSDRPDLEMFCASSPGSEIREIACRIRTILEKGSGCSRPETIGVVARDLEPYCMELRREFSRLAVPFSGGSASGPKTTECRRIEAVADLLNKGCSTLSEIWLGAFQPSFLSDPRSSGEVSPWLASDILSALRGRGITRLKQAARMSLDDFVMNKDGSGVLLPSRMGFSDIEDGSGEIPRGTLDKDEERKTRLTGKGKEEKERRSGLPRLNRVLAGDVLSSLLQKAADLISFFESLPERASFAERVNELHNMLQFCLGWSGDDAELLLSGLLEELPQDFELTPAEFSAFFSSWAESDSAGPLGGAGGGVQVLSVTEARGHTFEHLFLAGMKRGFFPRTINADPLLPDDLRSRMRVLLPDLPVKTTGYEEERYLFRQLLCAAQRVTLSYHTHDSGGSAVSPSTFVEQLLMDGAPAPECVPDFFYETSGRNGLDDAEPVLDGRGQSFFPAFEHAIKAGLAGRRDSVEWWLANALEQDRLILPSLAKQLGVGIVKASSLVDPGSLARGRMAVLDEFDPDFTTSKGAMLSTQEGPYFGFVSKPREGADPRNGRIFITRLERLSVCPWQVFVTNILRVEQTADPMEDIPDSDNLIIGNIVHAVLAWIAAGEKKPVSKDITQVLTQKTRAVPWPDEKTLSRMISECARDALKNAGIDMPGLAGVAALQAKPYLERCRELEWSSGSPEVLGAELYGAFTACGSSRNSEQGRKIHFRVDRVDRKGDEIILIDYKTGKPISEKKNNSSILNDYLQEVKRGRKLQALAYEAAAAEILKKKSAETKKLSKTGKKGGETKAVGRYVFLKPDSSDAVARVDCGERQEEFAAVFDEAVSSLCELWDSGVFFPKAAAETTNNDRSSPCSYCSVAEACLRGDSGFRSRLAAVLEKNVDDVSKELKILVKTWKMGEQK